MKSLLSVAVAMFLGTAFTGLVVSRSQAVNSQSDLIAQQTPTPTPSPTTPTPTPSPTTPIPTPTPTPD